MAKFQQRRVIKYLSIESDNGDNAVNAVNVFNAAQLNGKKM
ncbi:MAG: hypothetical protein SCALA701_14850 [Candidatus Scalindua sp.]|nr:MAG: hypothetical protein SCALA701_14850 [Candidatus Scalindua sp.]